MPLSFRKQRKSNKGFFIICSMVMVGFIGKIYSTYEPYQEPVVQVQIPAQQSEKIDITKEVFLRRENERLKEQVSRGQAERTYSMKPYIWRLCKEYGEKYGIPKEVWYPIIMLESNGRPACTTITKYEDSRGLLQINTRVHPVDKTKVYDPEYNLDYQMPELAEKYKEAKEKGMAGLDVVWYVERYGQKCLWTENVKQVLKKYYDEVMGQ